MHKCHNLILSISWENQIKSFCSIKCIHKHYIRRTQNIVMCFELHSFTSHFPVSEIPCMWFGTLYLVWYDVGRGIRGVSTLAEFRISFVLREQMGLNFAFSAAPDALGKQWEWQFSVVYCATMRSATENKFFLFRILRARALLRPPCTSEQLSRERRYAKI